MEVFNMKFDFYKPYALVMQSFAQPIDDVDRLMHDIYQYNDKLKDALHTSKGIKFDVLLNFKYPKYEFRNSSMVTAVPYIFTNALNPFALVGINDDCSLFTIECDFSIFLEIYICARILYREMGSEIYDIILDIFKWGLKYVYAYISLILDHVWLDGDYDSVVIKADRFENEIYGIFNRIKHLALKQDCSVTRSWYVLITDNIVEIMKNIKSYLKDSDWFKYIIGASEVFKDIDIEEGEGIPMDEETDEILVWLGFILGCIYYRFNRRNINTPYKKALGLKELIRDEPFFRYYKLENGVEWTPESSESKEDEEFQKKIEAELKDTKHIIDSVFSQAALEVMLNGKEDKS